MGKIRYFLFLFVFGSLFQTAAAQRVSSEPDHPLYQHSDHLKYVRMGEFVNAKSSVEEQLLAREEQGWDGSEFIPATLVENSYNGGLRTEERESAWNPVSQEWMQTGAVLYEYVEGHLTVVVEQTISGSDTENEYRTLIEYNEGQTPRSVRTVTDQFWDGDEWMNEFRSDLTYENGTIQSVESSGWNGSEWEPEDLVEVSETDGSVTLTTSFYLEGEWETDYREIYPETSAEELFTLFIGELGNIETGSFLMLLDMLPDYVEQEWNGDQWEDVSRQVSEQIIENGEVVGVVILQQTYDSFEEIWYTDLEISLSFQDEKLIEGTVSFADDFETETMMVVYSEELTYNDQDLLETILRSGFLQFTAKGLTAENSTETLEISSRALLTWSGQVTSTEEPLRPVRYALDNAYPNPFNPSAVVPFETAVSGPVSIKVYDVLGRYVMTLADEVFTSGRHTVQFDGSGLTSGVYMIRLQAPDFQQTKRVTLLK